MNLMVYYENKKKKNFSKISLSDFIYLIIQTKFNHLFLH